MLLPDYMYLDIDRLQNYLSTLDPGEVQEFTVTTRAQRGNEGRAGFRFHITEAGGGARSEDEITRERTMRVTAQHMFSRVHEELDKANSIKVFDEEDPLERKKLRRREVVEITRSFSPSPLNSAIDGIMNLMGVMEQIGFIEEVASEEAEMGVCDGHDLPR
jgi:hypothetical protein